MFNCFYLPQRSCGQGYVFTRVCNSVHGGGSASVHAGIPPPGADIPPGSRHPPPGSRLRHTVNERPVRIQLECILVAGLFYLTYNDVGFAKTVRKIYSEL